MMKKLAFLSTLICVCVFGCSDNSSDPDTGSETHWISCETDSDCPSDQQCIDERCATNDDGDVPDWRRTLDDLQDADAIFSLAFMDSQTPLLTGSFLPGAGDQPCETFVDWVQDGPPEDLWIINFDTSGTEPGQYEIKEDFDEYEPNTAGLIVMEVAEDPSNTSVHATGGTITVTEAPADHDDWDAGVALQAHIEAEFPDEPMRLVGCEGDMPVDGGYQEVCTCEDAEGNQSTCRRKEGDDPCCESSGEVTVFEVDVSAEQCGYLCYYSTNSDQTCAGITPAE